jgi:alpha-L-rhamnosidase
MRGSFLSVPTDCPQLDERLGWTGDIQTFCPTANFLYDTTGMLSGWLKGLATETLEDGDCVPPLVSPNILGSRGKVKCAIWADCLVSAPWDI